jgi:cell division protein FtsN
MDWIRRNWPDLLIGLALLLVIGGIIATLLNGGNILPFGRSATNPPTTVSTQAPSDATATNPVAPTGVNGGSSASTDSGVTDNSVTDSGIAAVDPNATTNDTVTMPADQGGDGTITPVSPTLEEGDVTTTSPDAATTTIDEAVSTDTTDATAATDTTPSASTTDVAASSAATAPYRISVGAFGSVENAERRAQAFRDAGYPVFTGNQGDLVLVLIGPYDSQAEAEGVKARLQSSGLEADPIIYEFTSNDAAVGATPDAPASTEPSTTEPSTTTAPTTSAPATSSSGRYLQVGAYGSLESAAPQRTTLEGLGFTVSAVEEGSFVKLLVGPYDDASIATAQSQLSAQGIDSFVR